MAGTDGLARIAAVLRTLRAAPPAEIGGLAVLAVCDYEARTRTEKGKAPAALVLPRSNVLAFELEGANRIIARPSGTEPKIKFYFDLREPIAAGETVAHAEARAQAQMGALAKAFLALAGL
jgi:phosphomannomutase